MIEVLEHPGRAMRAGVWMIPAILIGEKRWFHAPSLAELEAALLEE